MKAYIRHITVVLLVCGLSSNTAPRISAAEPSPGKIIDVALTRDASLYGQLVDPQGVAKPNVLVSIQSLNGTVQTVMTDAQGRFLAQLGRGGIYTVTYGKNSVTLRAWTFKTAPPAAGQGVLLVANDPVALGQSSGGGGGGGGGLELILFGGLTAAALAVGIDEATNGASQDSNSGS